MPIIIPRAKWGARYKNGFDAAPIPASEVWLHHTVTLAPDIKWVDIDGDNVDDDEEKAMRLLEQIGEDRFGRGISYTWLVPPSGRIYEGHSVSRMGAHTGGRNSIARAIALIGDYTDRPPTREQEKSIAWLLNYAESKDWILNARLNGGHRQAPGASTACPGNAAFLRIGAINEMAATLSTSHPTPKPEDDDMTPREFLLYKVGRDANTTFDTYNTHPGTIGHFFRTLRQRTDELEPLARETKELAEEAKELLAEVRDLLREMKSTNGNGE